MIEFLSSWVKNLSFALIIVSILEMVLPDNKTKKYVKVVMGLYILFSIISPFVENSNNFNLANIDTYADTDFDTVDNNIKDEYLKRLKNDVQEEANKECQNDVEDFNLTN